MLHPKSVDLVNAVKIVGIFIGGEAVTRKKETHEEGAAGFLWTQKEQKVSLRGNTYIGGW